MSRPTTVTVSSVLWILSLIARLAVTIPAFIALAQDGTPVPGYLVGLNVRSGQAEVANGAGVGGVISIIVVCLVEVFFVVKMRSGRNWARVVLTVLGALGILGDATWVDGGQGFAVVSLILSALAIVLMYVGGANAFFRKQR